MEFTVCPLCGSSAIKKKKGSYRFNIKGKVVSTPVMQYWECPHCGEAFFDRQANKQIDEALLLGQKPISNGQPRRRSAAKARMNA
jgi:YgiT-type zinc finger domain-containing protein